MQIRIFTWAGQNVISTGFSNSCVRCGCAMTFIIRVLTALSLWEIKKVSLAFLYFPWKSSMKSIWYENKWVEFSLKISRSKEHSLKIPSCSQSDKKKKCIKTKIQPAKENFISYQMPVNHLRRVVHSRQWIEHYPHCLSKLCKKRR